MKRITLAIALLLWPMLAWAAPENIAIVVATCGTADFLAGRPAPLTVDVTGVLCKTGGGGSGSPGGSNTQVQYNQAGSFGGITGATSNGTVLTLVAPILGTPASATLTNATGLPISTGVSGLGAGIATWLGTPSSANLISALTDETGSSSAVFANTPTLITPILGVASATSVNKVAITAPATSATLTLVDGTTLTGPAASGTAMTLGNAEAVAGIKTFATGQIVNGTLRLGTVSSITGQLLLANSASANLTTIQAGNAAAARTYTWPTNFGAAGTVLTDAAGDGTLSWAAAGGGSGIAVGTTTVTSGTATRLLYETAGNVVGEISGATSNGTALTLVAPILGTPASATLTNATGLPAAGVVGTAAILGLNTFTALQTITQASANAGIIASTGYSLTGSNATNMVDLAGTWNTSGAATALKIAMTVTSGASAKFISVLGGAGGATNILSLDTVGNVVVGGTTSAVSAATFTTANTFFNLSGTSGVRATFGTNGGDSNVNTALLNFVNYGGISWSSSGTASGNYDTIISRFAPANIRLGYYADAAAPVAQTFSVQGVVAGTTNTAGALWVFQDSIGTGTGASGGYSFKVAPLGGSGTSQNAVAAALTISGAGLVAIPLLASDATHTDSSVCQDTTTHALYAGSGTLGVCLGTSSLRFKRDIKPMSDSCAQLAALDPKTFRYKKGYGDSGARRQGGFLAEEMEGVLPGLVGLDANGKPNSVDLIGLIPIIVNCLKEARL